MSYSNETNTSMATSFAGARVEKTWSGEFRGDGKDRWEESEGASETEVFGQLTVRIVEEQSESNRAHQGFKGQNALAAHGRQRRRRRHGNLT